MGALDRRRCRICGGVLESNYCPRCDRAVGKRTKGQTNDGSMFGFMSPMQVKFNKIRNAQAAEYGGNLIMLDKAILRCREYIHSMEKKTGIAPGLTEEQKYDFAHLFNLANMGRYYVCVQLKETADLLKDSDLIKEGDDPWGLGRQDKQ